MKKILRIIMLLILIISSFGITNAAKGLFDSEDNKKIYLCDGSDC
jgi:ABC-type lipoprotein release transport system permease subunit